MGHDHGGGTRDARRLGVVLAMVVVVLAVEAVVGLLTGSLALLADAGHMLGDSIGLVMALASVAVARRRIGAGSRRSFGALRTETLVAGVNALIVLGVGVSVVVGAVRRLGDPVEVEAWPVLAAGAVGLVVNAAGLLLLRQRSSENLAMRGAYLEVLGDALGSVAVLVSATVLLTTGWTAADPVASLVIAALMVPRAVALLREVVDVLLESTPRGVDLADLRAHMLRTPGVRDVHDLHVWSIGSDLPVMSAHVVVDDDVTGMAQAHAVLDRVRSCLSEHFDVEHSTIQLEPVGHAGSEHHLHR